MAAWVGMLQDDAGCCTNMESVAGLVGTPVKYKADVFTYPYRETFGSRSCTSGWDGRLFLHPEGKRVKKAFVVNKDKQEKHFSNLL